VVINQVAVGYDTYAVALRPDLMEREVSDLFMRSLDDLSLTPGIHYDRNYCHLAYKDEYGIYHHAGYSNALISAEREYYFVFNLEEDPGYCWNVDHLPSATVNGNPADGVQWYSNGATPNGSIDVYQRVYVSASADYVAQVTINPYRIKIQKGKHKSVSVTVEGSVNTVNWTMYNSTSDLSNVSNTGRINIGPDETATTLVVRATSTFNPNKYDEIEVIVSDEPVYIDGIIVSPNPGNIVPGHWLTLEGQILGTELPDFTWELVGDHNTGTRISNYNTFCELYVDMDETEPQLTVRCTSLHDPTAYKIVSVFVDFTQIVRITDVVINFDVSGLPLDTNHTGYDVDDALKTVLEAATISESVHFDLDYCYLAYLSSNAYYREYDSTLDEEKEYYLILNLEENPDYVWDVNTLPNVTVNGISPHDVKWYSSPSADGSIDVYVRVYLNNRPQLILQKMSTDGMEFSWSAMEGYSKYELYRDGVLLKTVTGTSYVDNVDAGIPWGKTRHMNTWYTYKVRGVNGSEHTDFSAEETVLYNPFVDVSPVSDFYPYIVWAYNNQIVNGIEGYNNIFSPEGDCERMNFCIMLWKIKNKPYQGKKTPFKDLGGLSTNNVKAITWCYNKKIVNGYTKTQFKPHNNITRAQLAIMIWKMAGKPSVDGLECPYTDIEVTKTFTANNRKAVIWCYNYGLINSIEGDKFLPDLEGTRSLLTEMLYGYNKVKNIISE
nr:S-layer homology domain-containing protein [Erysipelotrichaceae bacterium]